MPLDLDVSTVLQPFDGEFRGGTNLRGSDDSTNAYRRLRDLRKQARDEELQADTMSPPPGEPTASVRAMWREVWEDGLEYLRTVAKDLEIVGYMIEASIRIEGYGGLAQALKLTRELIDTFWGELLPTPDEDGVEAQMTDVAVAGAHQGAGDDLHGLEKPPPRFDSTIPLGSTDLHAAVPPPPTSSSASGSRRSAPPPAPVARSGSGTSPGLSVPLAPKVPTMRPPAPPAAARPAATLASREGDLDYDDLAETIARDRELADAADTGATAAMPATSFPTTQSAFGVQPGAPMMTSQGMPAPQAYAAMSTGTTAMPMTASTTAMPMTPGGYAPSHGGTADEPDALPMRRVPPAVLWIGGVVAFCVVASGSGAVVSYR